MKPAVIAGIVIACVAAAGLSGYLLLKPSIPSFPSPSDDQQPLPENVPHLYAGHFGTSGYHSLVPGMSPEEARAYFAWESALMANAGITWNRTSWTFTWGNIEVSKGNYSWGLVDDFVKTTQAKGIHQLALIHTDAQWDSPPGIRKPSDMDAFKTFVRTLVERYDGDGTNDMPGLLYGIKYWEISNEPEMSFTAQDYFDTLKAAHEAIKSADPDAKVLNAGAVPIYKPIGGGYQGELDPIAVAFWDNVLTTLGGINYVDILSVHYGVPVPTQPLENFLDYWIKFGKEIWMTEGGIYSGAIVYTGATFPSQTEEEQAGWWVRYSSYAFAHGVKKVWWSNFWHGPDTPDWFRYSAMINSDNTTKLVYTAQRVMASKIDNFSSVQELWYGPTGGHYKFIVDNKPVYVLWGSGGVPAEISGTVRVTDIRGNVQQKDASQIILSDSPIFVEGA